MAHRQVVVAELGPNKHVDSVGIAVIRNRGEELFTIAIVANRFLRMCVRD